MASVLLRSALLKAVAVGLGVAALAVTLGDGDRSAVAAMLVTALLAVEYDTWRLSRTDLAEASRTGLLGYAGAVRLAVAAATAVCFERWTDQADWTVAVAALVAAGPVALEPALAQARQYRVSFVSNLPGVVAAPQRRELEGPAIGGHLLALGIGVLLARGGASAWWWAAVLLLAAVPYAVMGLNAVARMRAGRAIDAAVPGALERYAPQFVVYTAWPEDGTHQVTMWLPYLQRTGRRFVIVTRHNYPAELLARHTDVPIVVRHGSRDLDEVLVPSLTTAFYVNASSGNGIFVRYHQLTHVFLGHGDSDKPSSYNPTHAMYDRIFAAGEAAVRRYGDHGVHIPRERFDVVGRPQVETVQRVVGPVPAEPTVLYAPTWRGHVEETAFHSLPVGAEVVSSLLERGATVVFRPHPFSYGFPEDAERIAQVQQLLAEDHERTARPHRWGPAAESEWSIVDCVNAADAMVSDVSSVVSDFLQSEKPFAMMAMTGEVDAFVEEFPVAAASYVIDRDLANLAPALDRMLGDDPMAQERSALRVDYLGDLPADGYADVFVDQARQIIDHRHVGGVDEEVAETDADERAAKVSLSAVRSQLAVALRDVATVGLAALVLAVVLVDAPRLAVALLALLTVALMVLLHRRARWGSKAFEQVAGSFQPARLLLALSLAVGWSSWYDHPWVAFVGAALIGFEATLENTVFDCWRRAALEVRNLPALDVEVRERVPRGLVGSVGIGGLAVGWILALFGAASDAAGALLGGVGVVVLGLFAVALAIGIRRVGRCEDAEHRLHGTLEVYAPEFAVYFGSNIGGPYQLGMWMPYLERIGRPFVVVTRNIAMFRAIEGITDAPIVHRPTIRSLEDVVVPSLRACFYVNNATNNTHFIERRQMVHVWLNHGDSEKPACYNPVHAIYDLIFSAGQAGIDRYARHGVEIPRQKFRVVGRPQVEDIDPPAGPIADVVAPTVLYAPTWRGPYADSEFYSLPRATEIIEALLARGATVIHRTHPFNRRLPDSARMVARVNALLAADRSRTKRPHQFGDEAERAMSLPQCFNASDAMVADVSGVVSDYLQSGKPFAMVSMGRSPDELRAEAPSAAAAYVVSGDLANLDECLDAMLGPDPQSAAREQTRAYYLGDFPADNYAEGFLGAARRVIDDGPVDHLHDHERTHA